MNDYIGNGVNNDLAFEDFLKRFKGFYREERPRINLHLFNKVYFNNINKPSRYKQQVVLKIPNKGRGVRHLNLLLKYISRDLPQHENVESENLYGSDGTIIPLSEIENITARWSEDFPSNDSTLSDDAQMALEEVQRHETLLSLKKDDGGLNKQEKALSLSIRKFKDRGSIKNQEGIMQGDFVKDKDGQMGFIKKKEGGGLELISMSEEGDLKSKEITIDGAENQRAIYHKSKLKLRNDFTHMILSTGGDNPNVENSFKATKDFLGERITSKGYDYYFAQHNDTKHLHYHVVIRHRSRQKEQPLFSVDRFDLLDMRERYAEHLDSYGIVRQATYKFDRKDYLESINKRMERVQESREWYKYKIEESKNSHFAAASYRNRVLKEIEFLESHFKEKGLRKEAKLMEEKRKEYEVGSKEEAVKIIDYTVSFLQKDFKELELKYFDVFVQRVDPSLQPGYVRASCLEDGALVKALDSGNLGTVVFSNVVSDTYGVDFVHPETGKTHTMGFKASELKVLPRGQHAVDEGSQRKFRAQVKALDEEGQKSFDRNLEKYQKYLDSQIEEIKKLPNKILDDEIRKRQGAVLSYLNEKRECLKERARGDKREVEMDFGREMEMSMPRKKDDD